MANEGPASGNVGSALEDSGSDNDHERPVREKLEKASLGAFPKSGSDPQDTANATTEDSLKDPIAEFQPAVGSNNERADAEGQVFLATEQNPQKQSATSEPNGEDQDDGHPGPNDSTRDVSDETVPDDKTQLHSETKETAPLPDNTSKAPDHAADQPPSTAPPPPSSTNDSDPASESLEQESVEDQPSTAQDAPMEDGRDGTKVPRKKRSRDQFNEDLEKGDDTNQTVVEESRRISADFDRSAAAGNRASRTIRDEPEKKRHRDASQEASSDTHDNQATVSHSVPCSSVDPRFSD